MEKEAKEVLFRELYQLDQESSGEEDQSNISVILRQSRHPVLALDVSARIPGNRAIHSSRLEQSLSHTISPLLPQPSASSPRQANVVEKSSFSSTASLKSSEQVIIETPIMAKKIANMTAQKVASKATRKRKRGQSLELKPESQQIFNGLGFCRSHYL